MPGSGNRSLPPSMSGAGLDMPQQPLAVGHAGEPVRNTTLDLALLSVREVNRLLHAASQGDFLIKNPRGLHAIVAGLDGELNVSIDGHVGYYCAGMNKQASISISGNAGTGVAENIMSGRVHVKGDVSQSAGAAGSGGVLISDATGARRARAAMRRPY